MITSKDRSYYIGASDTAFVVGNWNTKTFEKWYGTKLGIYSMDFVSASMRTGTAYEHRIIKALNIKDMETDKQVITGRLRVNLDGNTTDTIYEIKTTNSKPVKPYKEYINQVNVEMYGTGFRNAYIVLYEVTEAEYKNYYLEIDTERLYFFKVDYNEEFINNIYLPRFNHLSECLDKGVWPKWNSQDGR